MQERPKFKVHTKYSPAGDQPKAIQKLTMSIKNGNKYNTLHGVTGSGKTYTMAKVIEQLSMPTLIMTHNKTLAAQLYSEFRGFFPNNHVEYFISYYDYYQPEAYIPRSDLFIEKDSAINAELERLRLSASASLLSFDDVICVASVSANYGLGDPNEYKKNVQTFDLNSTYNQSKILLKLVEMGYKRDDAFFERGKFRVNGDVVDIFLAYEQDWFIRLEFFGDEIENIFKIDFMTSQKIASLDKFIVYSANAFIVSNDKLAICVKRIEDELADRLKYFKENDKLIEANRLQQRVEFDLEMIQSTGMCKGIENYSRLLTDKKPGETPYTLIDYFESKNMPYLLIVDESHVSLPQFRGMYAGDRSRKEVLVDYGFRLPSALDNRPLMFDEFINKKANFLFVSATPGEIELDISDEVATQIIRPTGLLDPVVEVVPSTHQVEHLHDEIKKEVEKGFRVLITVLTKKMAEDLCTYYCDLGIKTKYMHSDLDSIERNQIIRGLRRGEFDVLIGINLLREGLDIPETSLVAILDADKEGFLRSEVALIQTIGRAARNSQGRVILYANKTTPSMKKALDTTKERRAMQDEFNKKHNITPKSTTRALDESLRDEDANELYNQMMQEKKAKMPPAQKQEMLKELRARMNKAAKNLDFEKAISLRDEIEKIKKL